MGAPLGHTNPTELIPAPPCLLGASHVVTSVVLLDPTLTPGARLRVFQDPLLEERKTESSNLY